MCARDGVKVVYILPLLLAYVMISQQRAHRLSQQKGDGSRPHELTTYYHDLCKSAISVILISYRDRTLQLKRKGFLFFLPITSPMSVSLPDTECHSIFVGKTNSKFFLCGADKSEGERQSIFPH